MAQKHLCGLLIPPMRLLKYDFRNARRNTFMLMESEPVYFDWLEV
jgi:hypothetical protein